MEKRITRLEEGLSPKEKAALVFSLQVKEEWDEAARIERSVSTGCSRIPDVTYWDRSNRLTILAFAWGFMHYQQVAMCEPLYECLRHQTNGRDRAEIVDGLATAIGRVESRLVALDTTLQEVCEANGVDVQAVRRLVDVKEPYSPAFDTTPDAEYSAKLRECLSRLAA